MFDDDLFDHLTPRGTAEIPLEGVSIPATNENHVVLVVKFAGRGTPFLNALTKAAKITDKLADAERTASLFARYAVEGWKNVEKDGKPVPYTAELGAEVFHKLIRARRPEIVDLAITRAMNADNFRAPVVEAADLGKG